MSKVVKLYIFRHGETDWNKERRLQGHTDTQLNNKGLEQANSLAKKIESITIDHVLSSDLRRASKTAELVFENSNIPLSFHHEFRESHLGEAQGMLLDDVVSKFGQTAWDSWITNRGDHLDFKFPGGESKREHLERIKSFLDKFVRENDFDNIAISTHGGVVRRMLENCSNIDNFEIKINNCSLHLIEVLGDTWCYKGELD